MGRKGCHRLYQAAPGYVRVLERGETKLGCQKNVQQEVTALRENDVCKTKCHGQCMNKQRSLWFVTVVSVVVGKNKEVEPVWKPWQKQENRKLLKLIDMSIMLAQVRKGQQAYFDMH